MPEGHRAMRLRPETQRSGSHCMQADAKLGVRPLALALCIVGALFATGTAAQSAPQAPPQTQQARLTYQTGADVTGCTDVATLQNLVSARIGYDPFDIHADLEVLVRIGCTDAALVARIETRRPDREPGVRTLSEPLARCDALIEAVVLAVSIAIDPTSLGRASGQPPALQAARVHVGAARTPEPSKRSPVADKPVPPEENLAVGLTLGLVGALGSAPKVSIGFQFGAELRWAHGSVGIGGRVDLPASTGAGGGTAESNILVAELPVCGWFAPVFVCGVGQLGVFRGAGHGLMGSTQVTRPHAAVGGRLGVEVTVYGPLRARCQLDLLAAITRTSLRVGDERVWIMSPLSGALSALLALQFS